MITAADQELKELTKSLWVRSGRNCESLFIILIPSYASNLNEDDALYLQN